MHLHYEVLSTYFSLMWWKLVLMWNTIFKHDILLLSHDNISWFSNMSLVYIYEVFIWVPLEKVKKFPRYRKFAKLIHWGSRTYQNWRIIFKNSSFEHFGCSQFVCVQHLCSVKEEKQTLSHCTIFVYISNDNLNFVFPQLFFINNFNSPFLFLLFMPSKTI